MISFNQSYIINNHQRNNHKPYSSKALLIKNYNTTSVITCNKKLMQRKCVIESCNLCITEVKAHNIFQTINTAIKKSHPDTINIVKSNSILPAISFVNNPSFVKLCSTNIQKLIADHSLTVLEKLDILDRIYFLLQNSHVLTTLLFYAKNFILSAYTCLKICQEINLKATFNNPYQMAKFDDTYNCIFNTDKKSLKQSKYCKFIYNQLLQYPIAIDLLFIEEEYRFISNSKHPSKTTDLGAHIFDNEWLYMERCQRAFLYLLSKQATDIVDINFADLRNVNAILGGYTVSKNSSALYGCDVPRNYGHQFINLVKQGVICDRQFQYSTTSLNGIERMQELEYYLYCSLGLDIKLKEIIFKGNKYFAIKSSKCKNASSASTTNSTTKKLLNDLHGKTKNKAFIFSIIKIDEHNFYVQIEYCYHKPREQTCQNLLKIYYKKVNKLSTLEQKVNLAVSLCSLLQRIHPFLDANGRTLFFILLPVLLYQMGIWLLKMVRNPWILLELDNPKKLTAKILNMSMPAPSFNSIIDTWNKYTTLEETLRINCALGNIAIVQEVLKENPEVILHPIVNDPWKVSFNILEFVVIHKQQSLFIFLFNKYLKNKLTYQFLFNLLRVSVEHNQVEISEYILNYMKNTFDFSLPVRIGKTILI